MAGKNLEAAHGDATSHVHLSEHVDNRVEEEVEAGATRREERPESDWMVIV